MCMMLVQTMKLLEHLVWQLDNNGNIISANDTDEDSVKLKMHQIFPFEHDN